MAEETYATWEIYWDMVEETYATWANVHSDVHETKTQIGLRIRAVWSVSSFSLGRNFEPLTTQHAPSGYSNQTARMRYVVK